MSVIDYPRATIREIALALMVVDDLLCDYDTAEDALMAARRYEHSVETDPLWAGGKHCGDCTSEPHTCARCLLEEYEEKARALARAEGFKT